MDFKFLAFPCLLFTTECFAIPEIFISNRTTNPIKITYNYLKHNTYLSDNHTILNPNQTYGGETRRYVINNNYLIELIDTHIECSWLHTLGIKHPNGWGIKLNINYNEIITICANKYNVFDNKNHASIEYFQDESGVEKIIFRNIGWWVQNDKFPIEKEIILNSLKNEYSPYWMNMFLYYGDKIENSSIPKIREYAGY
ncbi:hypothetical protein QEJ31_05500 [Pigmentibacter sp. JX0631]|uniref:hypothetical protein n=1 Tax=Pigmentibacter sp. JX0631 TaxID=2976982 RepID=UPI0024697789|nr:hypothetical protein [Pigmentibacter sp. JX0631]WGL61049.1 hypothetical protein QEJ31_05500 [Pigmentibacter sp. JX0631]